eukprot:364209-Chlamydomonas_euryale.AAC.11
MSWILRSGGSSRPTSLSQPLRASPSNSTHSGPKYFVTSTRSGLRSELLVQGGAPPAANSTRS